MKLRMAIAALALAGAGIAVYLTVIHYAHVAPICSTGGCETVQHSSYAEVAGIPVALLGLVAYGALTALAAVRGPTAAFAGLIVSFAGVAFSGYLLWAQLGPIGAICQWCLVNDLIISVIAVLSLARLMTEPG